MELEQKMNVHIGIFDAAEVVLKYRDTGKNFYVSADVKTANLFNSLYPFSATYESEGYRLKNRVIPVVYRTRSQSRNHIRHKKIFYDKRGLAYKRISSKDNISNEVLITNVSKTADSGDLQSVLAELIQNFATFNSCRLIREIDDGKKHYRFIAKNEKVSSGYFDLRKKKEKAHLCSIYVENLKNNNDNILWDVSADKPIKLWIAKDEATGVPFVLEIKIDTTPLGELIVSPVTLDVK